MNINRGKALKKAQNSGFLTRLAKNQAGNVMPLVAAAVFPMAAMIGGAVDLSRVYMTQTRLQNACDAGALAARRAMSGQTPTSDNIAEGNKFFDFNFPAGSFGATSVTKSYAAGTVVGTINGTASAQLPASIMKIFGKDTFTVDVNCSSTLNIPNTDVVFVLDTSGSMAQTISGDTQSKIDGLRQAVKDFFVELGPGEASGPGRIRYGFVPYSSGVNVGRILNPNWMLDTATYNTRVPAISKVWTYTLGSESGLGSWSAWSSTPSSYNTASGYTGGWSRISNTPGNTTNVNGTNYRHRHLTYTSSATCPSANNLAGSSGTLVAKTDVTGTITGPNLQSTTNDPATYNPTTPPSQQVLTYGRTEPHTITGYRYRWQSVGGTNGCWLQQNADTYNKTQTASSTKSITWTQLDQVTGWSNAPGAINVSGLKNGAGWNASFSAANTTSTSMSVNLSGTGATSIDVPASQTINWRGCIEEAQSVNTITATSAIAIPADAFDMQIDLVPSNDAQRWRPHLPDLVWDSSNGQWQGAWSGWQENGWAACPSPASKLQKYTSDVTSGLSTSFASFVDTMSVIGGTQHDIGMVWGARMLSPDGIYASENNDAQAPGGFQVGRHIVFMTDGNMDARNQNYGPWGISRLDGRQVPTNQQDTDDGSQDMNNKHYRRMEMICNAAKAKGYTVWVVAFGLTTMPTSLANCATDSDHAALASDSTALKAKFKAIAETIGGLRLSQ